MRPSHNLLTVAVLVVCSAMLQGQRALVHRLTEELARPELLGVPRLERMVSKSHALLSVHVPSAVEACEEAEAEARRQGRLDYAALAMATRTRGIVKLEGRTAALEAMARARELLPADAPPELQGRFAVIESGLHYIVENNGEAASRLRDAFDFANRSGSKSLLADCLLDLHDLLLVTETGHQPADDLREAEALLSELGDRRGLLRVRWRWADVWLARGQESRAITAFDELLEEAREFGDAVIQSNVLASQYSLSMRERDYRRAVEIGKRKLGLARELGDQELLVWSLDSVAWAHLRAREAEVARKYVSEALTLAVRLGIPRVEFAVVDSAWEIALASRDKDALLAHSLRKHELRDLQVNVRGKDRDLAHRVLRELRDSRGARHAASRDRAAEAEWWNRLFLWSVIALSLLCASVVAMVFLAGKRRAEKLNRLLQEQSDRAGQEEEIRRRLEHDIRQLERLDSLGLLSAGVAHDFNNILCIIVGHAELLRDERPDLDRAMFDEILLAAQRATSLCKRLLDYAQPSFEDQEVVDLRDIVSETRTLLSVSGGGAMELVIECCEESVPVKADRSGIEQVLVNLGANASDPQLDASVLVVRVRRVEKIPGSGGPGRWFGRPASARSYALLEVEDDGAGLTEEQLSRIFDPFFTTKFEGRGLGLSAAYGIVTGHDGGFYVVSAPGRGTRFSAYLPLTTEGEDAGQPVVIPGPATLPNASRRVLVVDDEPWVLDFVRPVLERAGHAVHVARTGGEAIQIVENADHPPDVGLLDLSMPGMDGLQLMESLRERQPSLQFVIMSGHDPDAVRDRLGAKFSGAVLSKPFGIQALRDCIAIAAAESREADEQAAAPSLRSGQASRSERARGD